MLTGARGAPQDGAQAALWLGRASEQGVAAAQVALGLAMLYGRGGVARNAPAAVAQLRLAAAQGSAAAQGALGECYEKGLGVGRSVELSRDCYRQAAEQGSGDAAAALALLNAREAPGQALVASGAGGAGGADSGAGAGPTSSAASAAASKLLQSGNNEGVDGLPAEREAISGWGKKSLADLKLAAKRGEAAAQQVLGARFHEGDGVQQDFKHAALWYGKAAAQGFARAQLDLGTLHAQGLGMQLDYAEAVRWFRRAADHGDSLALYTLGACYEDGSGVEQSLDEACYWYKRAAEQGFEAARETLKELGR
jgi:hypothetical protein